MTQRTDKIFLGIVHGKC